MQKRFIVVLCCLSLFSTIMVNGQHWGKGYPVQPVPFTLVKVTDQFWSKRIETNRRVTLPHNFKKSEETGRIDNFSIAAGLKHGKFTGYHFNDSDVYKAIEGASYSLATHPDTTVNRYLDSIIAIIAQAQEPDGYLYTARKLIREDYQPPGGKERWIGIKDGSHELYNVGHLYEGAVAHFYATGKRTLLNVAIKNANLLCETFGPGKRGEVPGHEEIEIGLCKLYLATDELKYLNLAKFFIDERGNAKGHELMGDYAQDHKPVRDQDKAVGHAVRAMYLYSGMADVAALTGDQSLVRVLDKVWADVIGTKFYSTGGIGASGGNEGFSHPYELPNLSAYCETCASIANVLWNQRMALLHGDARYVDIIERTMYNAFLSGVGMSGDKFFYPNRLESFKGENRSEWFSCACCPPNVLRFIASLPGYLYATQGNTVFVNLFIGSDATIKTLDRVITLKQETLYPWDGAVKLTVYPDNEGLFALNVRIPGWVQNRPVPSDLYTYLEPVKKNIEITINGKRTAFRLEKNYAVLKRNWKKGDVVRINFPMEIHRLVAHKNLKTNAGRVALERGPVVFCTEGVDNANGYALNFVLNDASSVKTQFKADLLNGVQVLKAKASPVRKTLTGSIVSDPEQEITMIPYYAWAHRGLSPMTVWTARTPSAARALPAPTIAYTSKATASERKRTDAINDQLEPISSIDHNIPFLHWWPTKGKTAWIQYAFKKEETVSKSEVYWFDDTGIGECRLPASWKLFYNEQGEWKPVEPTTPFEIVKDRMSIVKFKPIKTTALKMEIQMAENFSMGLYEWKVE
ncbi:MAG: glycoside hydrolase family 127 protein [bacterium]